ncbi:MAG: septal ring lytic transglycosylase RlpA family protein [Hyphomicrobiales bacterium]
MIWPRSFIRQTKPWRAVIGIGVSLMVADCASQSTVGNGVGGGIDPKLGVRASRRLYEDGDPIPKGGGTRLVGHPYSVAGRTYVPQEVSHYSVVGLASWYGSAFHGRLTANGEVFDRYSISAAHKTLPLPSYARVTNIRNGRSIIVRVNDRGPYHANRVMDVSERVAEVLDFKHLGTTEIKLDYLRPASIAGSDDRKLLATLRTDGAGAVLDGPGSVPVMVASADLTNTPQASGPGAPIAAIASAVTAASQQPHPATTAVAYSAPASRPNLYTTITYSNGAGASARSAPAAEPAIAPTADDEQPANATTTVIRNDNSTHTTIAVAPLPPERPFDLGVSIVAKTQPAMVSQPSTIGNEDEVVAPRPPARPKQLATLFFASERLADTRAFTPGNPFAGLKPQSFVRLRTQ